jgi:hypothetical protein
MEEDEGKITAVEIDGEMIPAEDVKLGIKTGHNVEIPKETLELMDSHIQDVLQKMTDIENNLIIKGLCRDEIFREYIRKNYVLEIQVDIIPRVYTIYRKSDGKRLISYTMNKVTEDDTLIIKEVPTGEEPIDISKIDKLITDGFRINTLVGWLEERIQQGD